MVSVPEEGHVRHRRALQDLEQGRRIGEVAVRLDDDADVAALGVLAKGAQTFHDARERRGFWLARRHLVAEDADVTHVQLLRKVDESAPFIELRLARRGLGFVHFRGSAQIRDSKAGGFEILHALAEAGPDEFRPLRQVHLSFDAAQLDGGIPHLRRLSQNAGPGPLRTPERRERDRIPRRLLPSQEQGRRCRGRRHACDKSPASHITHQRRLPVTRATRSAGLQACSPGARASPEGLRHITTQSRLLKL